MATFNTVERTSAQYTATLLDKLNAAVALASIVTAKLTLIDVATGTVINSRNGQNILNANNVTIHATSGLLTWDLQPADNVIVASGVPLGGVELHRATFDVVYNTTERLAHEVYLLARSVEAVT